MKKRIGLLALAVLLLLALTVAVTADTAAQPQYSLCFGLANTHQNGDTVVTEYWPNSFRKGLLPSEVTSVTEFDYYVQLYDFSQDQDAPQTVYETFWENYDVTIASVNGGTSVEISDLKIAADEYHRYVTVKVHGQWTGDVFINAVQKDDAAATVDAVLNGSSMIMIAAAEKLTITDGAASFSRGTNTPNTAFCYVELDPEKAYEVSGEFSDEAAEGSISIFVENGTNTLWNYWGNGSPYIRTETLSGADYAMVEIMYGRNATAGTLFIEEEQPCLRYAWEANAEPDRIRTFADMGIAPGDNWDLYLFCGTSMESTLLTAGELTSADPEILTVEKITENEEIRYRLNAVDFGETTLTYTDGSTTYTTTIEVTLPGGEAFYSAQKYAESTYLSSLTYDSDVAYTFWVLRPDGFSVKELEKQTVSVLIYDDAVPEAIVELVPRQNNEECCDVKITLPAGLDLINDSWLEVKSSGNQRTFRYSKKLWVVEKPDLMFRYMEGTPSGAELASWHTVSGIADMQPQLYYRDWVRFYYGTSESNIPVDEITVPADSGIKVTKENAKDGEPYWQLSYEKLGNTTLTISAGGETYEKTLTVRMPTTGFYSAQSRDKDHLLNTVDYRRLTDGVVWLIHERGFTAEEVSRTSVLVKGKALPADLWEAVAKANDPERFDLKITLNAVPITAYELGVQRNENGSTFYVANAMVDLEVQGNAAYIGDYAIGFAWTDEETNITTINEEYGWRIGNGSAAEPATKYTPMRTVQIAAGVKRTDEQGAVYYLVDESADVDLKINKTWIEWIAGEETVFSFSDKSCQQTRSDYKKRLDIDVYQKEGYEAMARVWAEVEATVGGKTEVCEVSTVFFTTKTTVVKDLAPADDTIEKLNARLDKLAEDLVTDGMYEVHLAPIEYDGTIRIPEAFNAGAGGCDLIIQGASDGRGNFTIVNGSLNLNGATVSNCNDVSFRATDNCPVGIYGGALLNMYDCSFEGYDIAVDATDGMTTITRGNLFVNNELAIRLDVALVQGGMNMKPWTYNTFINNGTAVQVLSLNDVISSYYFRVVNSNFFNNGTDFDLQCNATLYMYKNYYGRYVERNGNRPLPGKQHPDKHNGQDDLRLDELLAAKSLNKLVNIIESRSARVSITGTGRVITNPRWKHPVKNWWSNGNVLVNDSVFGSQNQTPQRLTTRAAEEEYEDILISDWELATEILNDEAGSLLMDPSAFADEGNKQIDVVDQDEELLGSWNFG